MLGSDFSPDLGDTWRNGCPKKALCGAATALIGQAVSPEWISSGPTSEADGGFEFCEHSVGSMAIEVIGQDRSSEVISLFLEDWEVWRGIKLPFVYGPFVSGFSSLRVFGVPKKVSGGNAIFSPWTGCDNTRKNLLRDEGEGKCAASPLAKDRREDFYDSGCKDNILGRSQTASGTVERAPQRPNCGTGQSFEVAWRIRVNIDYWVGTCCGIGLEWLVATHWNVPGKYGPHGELFFFFLKKEPTVISELIKFGPCISAETGKACALIGLHMMAEEKALRSDSDFSPDFGDMWRNGCPTSPEWISSGPTCEADGAFEFQEHNVEHRAGQVK